MAITVSLYPNTIQASHRPNIMEVTSNRYSSDVVAVTSVSSGTGAKARYACASHPYLVGDIITGSGFISTPYNVRQTVTVISATWFETNVDFPNSVFGGTMTRTNDNFRVKGEVIVFNAASKAITGITDAGGGLIEVTTGASHGYAVNDIVAIDGTAVAGYHNVYVISAVPGASTFRVTATFVSTQTGQVRKGTITGSKYQTVIDVSGTKLFRFNVSNIVQSSLTPDTLSTLSSNQITFPTDNAFIRYGVKFTEYFDDVDTTTKTGDTGYSNYRKVVRASLQDTDSISDMGIKFLVTQSTDRFLSNGPLKRTIRITEMDFLTFLAPSSAWKIRYQQYNLAGVAQSVVDITPTPSINYDTRTVFMVDANIMNATVSMVDVWVALTDNSQISEKRTYIIDPSNVGNSVRVFFENSLGGFEGYNFNGNIRRSNQNKKTSFTKDLGTTWSTEARGETALGVDSGDVFEAYSEFLSKAEGLWLKELFNSPNAFLRASSWFTSITILNGSDVIDDSSAPIQAKLIYRLANAPQFLTN